MPVLRLFAQVERLLKKYFVSHVYNVRLNLIFGERKNLKWWVAVCGPSIGQVAGSNFEHPAHNVTS
jgi:hypothetical protein